MRKNELLEKRNANAREARALLDAATAANRGLNDQERERVKSLETENATISTASMT